MIDDYLIAELDRRIGEGDINPGRILKLCNEYELRDHEDVIRSICNDAGIKIADDDDFRDDIVHLASQLAFSGMHDWAYFIMQIRERIKQEGAMCGASARMLCG